MPLLLLFIVVPLIEITLFVQLGSVFGAGWILFGIVASAVLGVWLVRRQGQGVLAELQRSLNRQADPSEPLANGAMLLLAGVLLIIPGFFTDTLGFLLLIPQLREKMFRWLRARVVIQSAAGMSGVRFRSGTRQSRPAGTQDVIEGEYTEIRSEPRRTKGPSGWTQD